MITRRIVLGTILLGGCSNNKRPQPPWTPPVPPPPTPTGSYHINPIIKGQRYQPPPSLPEWSDGNIEFPVGEEVGTIMKQATGPFTLGGIMVVDYELSGPIEQMQGSSLENPSYISAGLWFIRRGDWAWSGQPPLEHKTRWYSNTFLPVTAGRHQAVVPITFDSWGSATVPGAPAVTYQDFVEAAADPEWYGMILGDSTGRAHSWRAPVPGVKLIIHRLEVTA